MTELERRALLGDKEAQKECTEKWIVLPCPKCFKRVKVHGPEDWKPTFYDPDSGGDSYEFDCECGLAFSTNCYDFKQALAQWNSRLSPPIGRCVECKNRKTPDCSMYYSCSCGEQHTWETDNDFCSEFEPKENKKK